MSTPAQTPSNPPTQKQVEATPVKDTAPQLAVTATDYAKMQAKLKLLDMHLDRLRSTDHIKYAPTQWAAENGLGVIRLGLENRKLTCEQVDSFMKLEEAPECLRKLVSAPSQVGKYNPEASVAKK